MATTNNFSLPYPLGNDPYNIPEDIENLAKSIDSSLKAVSDSVATLDYSTTETVEEVQRNLEILEQEINRAGLPNIERIMIDIEEARKELEAAKEEFSVGQAELGVHLTNLRDERMPALEASVQEARSEMDTAMDEFMTRQTQFEDSISTAETEIEAAKKRLDTTEQDVEKAIEYAGNAQTAAEAAESRAVEAMSFVSTVLQNGSFEDGLTNWTTTGGAGVTDDITRSGDLAGLLPELGDALTYDETLTAVAGQVWELSGFYYCGIDPQIGITFTYYDENGTALETVSEIEMAGRVGVWNSFGPFRIEAPENSATMGFSIESVTDTGYVRVDDIALRDVTDVVRLEQAATAARQAANDAQSRAEALENELDRAGGIKDRLESAETNIQNKADSSRVDEVEGQVDTALTGPVTHDRLRAGSGAFDSAFVDELWAKNIRALSAELSSLIVASSNMIPNGDLTQGDEFWSLGLAKIVTDDTPPGYRYAIRREPNDGSLRHTKAFPVQGGQEYLFEMWIKADKPGSVFFWDMRDQNGTHVGQTAGGKTSVSLEPDWMPNPVWRPVSDFPVPTEWTRIRTILFPGPGVTSLELSVMYFNHGNGDVRDATVSIAGVKLTPRRGSEVIVDGAIQTRHLEVTGEMAAALISADKARVIDLIAEDLIANNATLINAAMQNLTVTERANFVDAFAKELYADEFTARVASMARATVAAPNPIPAVSEEVKLPSALRFFEPVEGSDGRFGFNTGHPSIWIQGLAINYTNGTVRLEAGQEYEFAVEVAGSVAGTRYYIDLTPPGWSSGDTFTRLASNELAGTTSNWAEYRQVFTVPETGEYRIKIWANNTGGNPPGASNPDGYQWFRGMSIRNILDGTLIATNSVKTPQLDVDEIFGNTAVLNKLFADLITARFLNAQEALIGGALIKNNEITVDKLTALDEILSEMLRVRKIDAGDIAADAITAGKIAGGAIDGKTITGSRVRTSASGRRVEMHNDAMTAYDSSGSIQARYSGDGIELRPPGGSLTPIGNHIFGAKYFEQATRSFSSSPGNSYTNWSYGPGVVGQYTPPGRPVRIDLSVQPTMSYSTGANMYMSFQVAIEIGGYRYGAQTFWLRNWPANTPYHIGKTTIANVGPGLVGRSQDVRIAVRYRAMNFILEEISVVLTPA